VPTFPGDPTLLGWITTGLYFIVAMMCVRTGRTTARTAIRPAEGRRHARFWLCIAALLVALGVNKQLDLQTLITQLGKNLAEAQGWYENRRWVQAAFVIFTLVAAIMLLGAFTWMTRQMWSAYGLALFGLALIIGFIVLRVIHIERVDEYLGLPMRASRARWVLELGGIVCIGLSAFRHRRTPPAF
jgi:hypothetical protein